eukprot:GHRR01003351.1.p1 GENE.GHRR01003351.1~~GHRR01003351.1.p1  ORF type:complete len:673 (+),score=232.53 GHRR01003351.1:391-2409(+)
MRWSTLSAVSAYKRADAHLTRQTTHGAVVTILGVLLGVTLACHEVSWYLAGKGTSKMAVDLARRHDLNIHVDISFPAIPCAGLSVDIMDASGSVGNDANHAKDVHLHKVRLDQHSKRIGGRSGEYVTPQSQKMVQDRAGMVMQIDLGAAMTQMSDMDTELQKHEGCRVYGDVSVRRVAGKLHFAVHQQSFVDVLPQMLTGHILPKLTNMSHVIYKVAFGPEYPGQVNPLDGFSRISQPGEVPKAYKYFLKVVPTEYRTRMGFVLETSQYSVSEYAMTLNGAGPAGLANQPAGNSGSADSKSGVANSSQPHQKVPEETAADPTGGGVSAAAGESHATSTVRDAFVDFSYDLSPIIMTIHQSPASILHFIVRLCAVVGGVLSVTRMADKAVHAVLVIAGAIQPAGDGKGPRHSSASSFGGYSARSSLPGDATAHIQGSRGYSSGSGSYPGHSNGGGYSNGSVDGNLHQRVYGSHPGSHPLSRMNSGSGLSNGGQQIGQFGGGILHSQGSGVAYTMSSGGASSMGGGQPISRMGSYGMQGPGSGSGGAVGDAITAASGNSNSTSSGGLAIHVAGGPTGAGQVSHLLRGDSLAPTAVGGERYSPGGTPTYQYAQQQQQYFGGSHGQLGTSRLSAASGAGIPPPSRTGSGMPVSNVVPGSPLASRGSTAGQHGQQQR